MCHRSEGRERCAHPLISVIITGETVGNDEEEDREEPKLHFRFISQKAVTSLVLESRSLVVITGEAALE
jgi:hypothetical protein